MLLVRQAGIGFLPIGVFVVSRDALAMVSLSSKDDEYRVVRLVDDGAALIIDTDGVPSAG